jgi:deoxyribodipyrimidine photo-lyase
MVQPQRVVPLNPHDFNPAGRYVLYWMQQCQRSRFNFALEHAIAQANERDLPVVVCFGLMDDFPESNLRHHTFMLQGLSELSHTLAGRKIRFLCKRGNQADVALHYGQQAGLIVCDRGYTRHQKAWREKVGQQASCPVQQVESDVVVPVAVTSDKREFAARTIRPKLHRQLQAFLQPLPQALVRKSSLQMKLSDDVDLTDPIKAAARLKLDQSVGVTDRLVGGEAAAHRALQQFLAHRLPRYATGRAQPGVAGTSMLAAYLHFGQISAVEIALAVQNQPGVPASDRDAFLEELIVRRELAMNFVHYTSNYDAFDCLPAWARKTLAEHRNDPRPHRYTAAQLEAGDTADPYWNAAQHEMNFSGYMHNQMRMYWGKKILEWTATPQEAYDITLRLNNKYFLCGRDPNGYANVGWIFGLHDRPWGPERPIFGLVRYMNAAGLKRKFDMPAYVEFVEQRAWEKPGNSK